ncbi:MAG TPA: nucleoside hydrolase [Gaiellaceae bacterium]|nr:nucleoside hydrolase [Gaiellaceae bacterium]
MRTNAVPALLFVLLALVAAGCGATRAARAPLVVDTDLSSDDLIALAYLLESPRVDVKAVTVSGTGLVECPAGARVAADLLSALGHADVPVACGRTLPLAGTNTLPSDWRTAADSMFGLDLPAARTDARRSAVSLLATTIGGSSTAPTVLELAPMTNLGETLRLHPGLAKRIRAVVAMGGAFAVPGNAPDDAAAETNVWVDPSAARTVLRSGVPLTLVPLDATNQVPVTTFVGRALRRYHFESPAATIVWDLVLATAMDRGGQYFWDPLAAATVTEGSLVTTASRRIAVAPDGRTAVTTRGTPARIVTGVNRAGFERVLLAGLLDGRPFAIPAHRVAATVTYDGTTCTYRGAKSVDAGPVALDTVNASTRPFVWVAGRLDGRHTFAQLERYALDPSGPAATPPWFAVDFVGTTPPHSSMTWLPTLQTGTTGSTIIACATQTPPRAWLADELPVYSSRG